MKKSIHPEYQQITILCISCDKSYKFESTAKEVQIDVCSNCHPYYLGTTISLKAAGRIDRFKTRMSHKNKN